MEKQTLTLILLVTAMMMSWTGVVLVLYGIFQAFVLFQWGAAVAPVIGAVLLAAGSMVIIEVVDVPDHPDAEE